MESTMLSSGASTMSILLFSKSLNSHSTPLIAHLHRRFSSTLPLQLAHLQLRRRIESPRSGPGSFVRALAPFELRPNRSQFSTRYSVSTASGGGGFGGIDGGAGGGGGGGGDGSLESGDFKPRAVAPGAADAAALSPDVIILDVGGMTCGGCAASVKRILESQPQVSSASVNLTTETAVVWPVSEAKVAPNWQKEVGEALAKHLTTCGFKSNLRDSRRTNFHETFEKKMNQKRALLKESGRGLVVSWALCAVCIVGHLSHFVGAKAAWIHALHSTPFHMSLSLFTLLGPGRQLITDGLKSLLRGAPNMNTLVGLGAISSFAVSTIAALVPKLYGAYQRKMGNFVQSLLSPAFFMLV